MIFEVQRSPLGAKIATKSGLGALESALEPSQSSWRLPEGSWRHLGALLAALGELLERSWEAGGSKTSSGRDRGEIRERSSNGPGRGRGGVYTLSPWAKGVKGIKGLKG